MLHVHRCVYVCVFFSVAAFAMMRNGRWDFTRDMLTEWHIFTCTCTVCAGASNYTKCTDYFDQVERFHSIPRAEHETWILSFQDKLSSASMFI